MKRYTFLAFDCGATSGRGILATLDGSSFTMKEVYRFPSEIKREGSRMYWDVNAMYRHLIAMATVAAWMHHLLCWQQLWRPIHMLAAF